MVSRGRIPGEFLKAQVSPIFYSRSSVNYLHPNSILWVYLVHVSLNLIWTWYLDGIELVW
jgi:hypothetical protein